MKKFYLSQYTTNLFFLLIALFVGTASFGAGILFHVSIGSFDQELDKERLVGYDYVITKKADGKLHYQVGEFKDFLYAQRATNELRNRGFEYVEVVAFFNENKVSLEDAFVILENQNNADAERYSALNAMSVEELNRKLDIASTYYVVQIGVFSKQKDMSQLDLPFRIDETETDKGAFIYKSQEFKSLEDAREARKAAVEYGIEGAFLVAYRNGKRVSISQIESAQ